MARTTMTVQQERENERRTYPIPHFNVFTEYRLDGADHVAKFL